MSSSPSNSPSSHARMAWLGAQRTSSQRTLLSEVRDAMGSPAAAVASAAGGNRSSAVINHNRDSGGLSEGIEKVRPASEAVVSSADDELQVSGSVQQGSGAADSEAPPVAPPFIRLVERRLAETASGRELARLVAPETTAVLCASQRATHVVDAQNLFSFRNRHDIQKLCTVLDTRLAVVQSFPQDGSNSSALESLDKPLLTALEIVSNKFFEMQLALKRLTRQDLRRCVHIVVAATRYFAFLKDVPSSAALAATIEDRDYQLQMVLSAIGGIVGDLEMMKDLVLAASNAQGQQMYSIGSAAMRTLRLFLDSDDEVVRVRGRSTLELCPGRSSFSEMLDVRKAVEERKGCFCQPHMVEWNAFFAPLLASRPNEDVSKKLLASFIVASLASNFSDASECSTQRAVRSLPCTLLSGEALLFIEHNVTVSAPQQLLSVKKPQREQNDKMPCQVCFQGCMFVTNYRLFFTRPDGQIELMVPVPGIASVEKVGGRSSARLNADQYRLEFNFKDLRSVGIVYGLDPRNARLPSRRVVSCLIQELLRLPYSQQISHLWGKSAGMELAASLSSSSQLGRPMINGSQIGVTDGWRLYDAASEYQRLGLPDSRWRLSVVNRNYEICDSYPSLLVVPQCTSDEELVHVAEYRSKGRLPALTYIHPLTKAAILRCSQPRSGVARRTCTEDEQIMQSFIQNSPFSSMLWIFDARPRANAVANTAKGAGFENMTKYPRCKLKFLGIPNIHMMRESLQKLREAFYKAPMDRWFALVDSSLWLHHVSRLLKCAVKIAMRVEEGHSVVCHCSDGWDRTAQLVSLAELMMDPYYRTLRGFVVLIEKEWLSFGHQFALRCGHDSGRGPEDQRSPIFLQFLDCVYQMISQYPDAFEFTDVFLVQIMDAVYSCQYGTFLYNTEKDRLSADLTTLTCSAWSVLLLELGVRNPFHVPRSGTLLPMCELRNMRIWDYYAERFAAAPAASSYARVRMENVLADYQSTIHTMEQRLALVIEKVRQVGDL